MPIESREENKFTNYLIGTGGWAYFNAPGTNSLGIYSKNFNFVEVNYTFYEYPKMETVERWRRQVPRNFVFTVRCHQDLTHKIRLRPVDQAYSIFSQMINICKILNAPFLHLLTPATYVAKSAEVEAARDLLSTIDLKGTHLAWETRGQVTSKLISLMQDLAIVHSVDLSKETPAYASDVVYSRVFGLGQHNIYQFADEELQEIDKKALAHVPKMVITAFHGVKMNSDALRFKRFKETGRFFPVTAFTGVDSVKAVLQEDGKFPTTKAEIVRHQGWKVVDLTSDRRVHLSDLLSKLPNKTYTDIQDVTKELEALL